MQDTKLNEKNIAPKRRIQSVGFLRNAKKYMNKENKIEMRNYWC